MILGIVTAVILTVSILLAIVARIKRLHGIKRKLMRAHCALSIAATAVAALHLVLTIKLFNQRPVWLFILGGVMLACMITSNVLYLLCKRRRWSRLVHRILSVAIALSLVLHIYLGVSSFSFYQKAVSAITISGVDVTAVADGSYLGECDVGYIYALVTVTVKDGQITDIQIDEHKNERGAPAETVIYSIIERQDIMVDSISGATNSSMVIKKAVENALLQGRG